MITLQNVSFSYPDSAEILFDGFSAALGGASHWTCITGANGCGKTTLLKLIAGMLPPLSGIIKCESAVYCAQNSTELPDTAYTLFWDADNEVRRFFSLLNITAKQLERWETLSGGEKKRLQIACALAERPSVLLLDEPTNHLDAVSKELIINALKLFTGTGLIVSHDRAFADSLCTATFYLYRESAAFADGADSIRGKLYAANVSTALELWDTERASCLSEWHKADAGVSKAKALSDMWQREAEHSKNRLRNVYGGKDHDAAQKIRLAIVTGKDRTPGIVKKCFDSRREQAEKRRDTQAKPLNRKEGFSPAQADTSVFIPKVLIHLPPQIISAGEDGSYTLQIPELTVQKQSRIALTGANGTGKTLLAHTILNRIREADLQKKSDGESLSFYLPQEIPKAEEQAVLAHFFSLDKELRSEILSTVYRMGSNPKALLTFTDSKRISPGELRKLMIALAMSNPLKVLILDEPTNHLDILSARLLETALAKISCALIIISHDSVFLQNCNCTELWRIIKTGSCGMLERIDNPYPCSCNAGSCLVNP